MSDDAAPTAAPSIADGASGEANFLRQLKTDLKDAGLYNALTDQTRDYVLRVGIPGLIMECGQYFSCQIPTIKEPADCDKAIDTIGTLQSWLDRLVTMYSQHLQWYYHVKQLRDNAAAYVSVNVKEVKALKSNELRQAAISYVLEDFDILLLKMDEFYDIVEQCRSNINRALANLRLQLDMFNTKGAIMMGAGRVAHAGSLKDKASLTSQQTVAQ